VPLEIGKFQSTRPHGARLQIKLLQLWQRMFQSTRPHGARRCCCWWTYRYLRRFNPRARTGRDTALPVLQSANLSFNPRARTGRDFSPSGAGDSPLVSIHAPARGATRGSHHYQPSQAGFNPRARTGRDAITDARKPPNFAVSIHAPARGATSSSRLSAKPTKRFNPRARTGRDTRLSPRSLLPSWFQSTRPHGARRPGTHPRRIGSGVSIHAPARGATRVSTQVQFR